MKNSKTNFILLLLYFLVLICLCIYQYIFEADLRGAFLIYGISLIIYFVLYFVINQQYAKEKKNIEDKTNSISNEALKLADIGILIYDKNFRIDWVSNFFTIRNFDIVGNKLTNWIPEVIDIMNGTSQEVIVTINEEIYHIRKHSTSFSLIFEDVTELKKLEKAYNNSSLVLANLCFDNYEEVIQYSNESEKANINTLVRNPALEYFSNKGVIVRKMKSSKYLLILNERIYQELASDYFSILATTRKNSKAKENSITLSMGIAKGGDHLHELDELSNELLELALSRGGDQIAIKTIGEETKFFGGNSESQEKTSKVKVRIMANTFRRLLNKASNIIVVGHKDMDADCVSAAFLVNEIAKAYNIPVYIIGKTGGIEDSVTLALSYFEDDLEGSYNFITESEALNNLNKDTLVVMVDHHIVDISNGQKVLKEANNIVVFDHHRRIEDLKINPTLLYIESTSSSATELLYEFIPYLSKNITISASQANIMYMGILIDTNNLINRVGSRTFDVLSSLRQNGADPLLCDGLLSESYDFFLEKNTIFSYAEKYNDKVIIIPIDNEKIYSRSTLSIVANRILKLKGVEATFAIGKISNDEIAISARSKGIVNVEVIMQKMNGGGHLTQAALQRENTTLSAINNELKINLETYFMEENLNESNTIK